jgi:hypothetical protein
MNSKHWVFSEMCTDTVFKLSPKHDVLSNFTSVFLNIVKGYVTIPFQKQA